MSVGEVILTALGEKKQSMVMTLGLLCLCFSYMGYNDPKVNKVLKVKQRYPNQQNINVQLEAVHQKN